VYSEQGLAAFWRGNLTNILRYFPTQAFNFAFKDSIKKLFPKPKTFGGKFAINIASGGLAGAGSLCIVYPLDYARTRLAADVGSGKKAFNGLADCLYKTATGPGGFMGLYNGFGVSVVGIIPFRGTYFGVNDTLVSINPYQRDSGPIGLASKFACAQTAALSAGYTSYPFDTVRRRLQMQSEKPASEWVYKGTMHCFRKILQDEGATALFKGAGANALRTVGSALVLVMYGEIKAWINPNAPRESFEG
jgi:solute carrier family 25 (adenine nucleotide translocator) protein 4/5/6/31